MQSQKRVKYTSHPHKCSMSKCYFFLGISHAQLGATPTAQYQVMGGGRFFPSVSREASSWCAFFGGSARRFTFIMSYVPAQEIAQAMQGVDILMTITSSAPWFHDFWAQEFFQCLTSDNLLDKCRAVVVRMVPWKSTNSRAKPQTVDNILKLIGFDDLKDKLCKLVIM